MTQKQWTIFVEPHAPTKPAFGAACNGCGVCCIAAPCPLGMVLSRRRRGACSALRWDAALQCYRCGALAAPQDVLAGVLPLLPQRFRPWMARALRTLAYRWIAAGSGCDSKLLAEAATIDCSGRADAGTPLLDPSRH
jgi:hypothetical protein